MTTTTTTTTETAVVLWVCSRRVRSTSMASVGGRSGARGGGSATSTPAGTWAASLASRVRRSSCRRRPAPRCGSTRRPAGRPRTRSSFGPTRSTSPSRARAVCALVADLVESAERCNKEAGGARGRRGRRLFDERRRPEAHGSDPEDGEIHEGAVVLALGDGDDALDFTDVLPTTATEARDGRDPRDAVGKRLRVWWPGEGRYFAGVVDRWDESRKLHVVRYDDGDVGPWIWPARRGTGKRRTRTARARRRVDEPPPPPPPSERRGVERTPDLPRAPGPDAPRDEAQGRTRAPRAGCRPQRQAVHVRRVRKGTVQRVKGIKLHRKMWCNKEGPFVGKKKGVETATAPGDAEAPSLRLRRPLRVRRRGGGREGRARR